MKPAKIHEPISVLSHSHESLVRDLSILRPIDTKAATHPSKMVITFASTSGLVESSIHTSPELTYPF